ncbi:MAG: alpha/beta hydrolase [Sandaracinaceae bacterium]
MGRWQRRVLGYGSLAVAVPFVVRATDPLWAVPLIDRAPNAAGPTTHDSPPSDARSRKVATAGVELDLHLFDPPDAPRGTVLILHGIRGRKAAMRPLARRLGRRGWRAVLVDLRGHGGSTGAHLTYGVRESQDLVAIVDALEASGDLVRPLAVHGTSYGGATALLHASRDERVDGVVAIAPFSSMRAVVRSYLRRVLGPGAAALPGGWVDDVIDRAGRQGGYDPDESDPARAAGRFHAPLFMAHGGADARIPPAHGDRIEAARGDRALERIVVPRATHDTVGGGAADVAVAFLDRLLSAS